jgi:hypothetical protein
MGKKPTPIDFEFTTEQVGSEVLERFSRDIYTPEAVVRELVKNAHDSYVELENGPVAAKSGITLTADDYVVNVEVVGDALVVRDSGIGLDVEGFKRLISIALTDKRDLDGATGFRGIGFWSAYMAGDLISVESTRVGAKQKYTLRLNTKRMRKLQGPSVSLGKIMNDLKCVSLTSGEPDLDEDGEVRHGTTLRIQARSEDTALAALLKTPETLRQHLQVTCSCRLYDDSEHKEAVTDFYADLNIVPTKLFFQGEEIRRRIPAGVGPLQKHEFSITRDGKSVSVAKMWFATNKVNKNLPPPFSGLRIMREGFPIGGNNPYSDRSMTALPSITSRDILNWHIGEIHLIDDELRPDAGGAGLRDGRSLRPFLDVLRTYYEKTLVVASRAKQLATSMQRDYEKHSSYLKKLVKKAEDDETLDDDEIARVNEIITERSGDDKAARGKLPTGTKPTQKGALVRVKGVKKARQQTGALLLQLQKLGALTASRPAASKSAAPSGNTVSTATKGKSTTKASDLIAIIDDVRDLAEDVLEEEDALRDEFLKKLEELRARYLD